MFQWNGLCVFTCAYFLRLSWDWSLIVAVLLRGKKKCLRNTSVLMLVCVCVCACKRNVRGAGKIESFVSSAVGHEKSPQSWAKESFLLKIGRELKERNRCMRSEIKTAPSTCLFLDMSSQESSVACSRFESWRETPPWNQYGISAQKPTLELCEPLQIWLRSSASGETQTAQTRQKRVRWQVRGKTFQNA